MKINWKKSIIIISSILSVKFFSANTLLWNRDGSPGLLDNRPLGCFTKIHTDSEDQQCFVFGYKLSKYGQNFASVPENNSFVQESGITVCGNPMCYMHVISGFLGHPFKMQVLQKLKEIRLLNGFDIPNMLIVGQKFKLLVERQEIDTFNRAYLLTEGNRSVLLLFNKRQQPLSQKKSC